MTAREYRQTAGVLHEVRISADGRSGRLVADVMKYDVVDDYRTSFRFGCFAESLEKRMPRILWSHNSHDPIGRWLDADDTRTRLRLAGQLDLDMIPETTTPAVPSAHRAWAQLNSGTIDQFSVGFLRQAEERNTPRQGVTAITQALLDEASPVLVGSVPGAELVGIRSGRQNTSRIFDMSAGRLRMFPTAETRAAGAGGQFAKGGGRVSGKGGAGGYSGSGEIGDSFGPNLVPGKPDKTGPAKMNSGAASKAAYTEGLAKTAKADSKKEKSELVDWNKTPPKGRYAGAVKKVAGPDVKVGQHLVANQELYKVTVNANGRNVGDRQITARPVARPNNQVTFNVAKGKTISVATA